MSAFSAGRLSLMQQPDNPGSNFRSWALTGRKMTPQKRSAVDAVDGSHPPASQCAKVWFQ